MQAGVVLTSIVCWLTLSHAVVIHPSPTNLGSEYIVTLKKGAKLEHHLAFVQTLEWKSAAASTSYIKHEWDIIGFHAYAGTFDKNALDKLKRRTDVASIERNHIIELDPRELGENVSQESHDFNSIFSGNDPECYKATNPPSPGISIQRDAPYYLRQISHRSPSNSSEGYVYREPKTIPRIYVLDSGIDTNRHAYAARVVQGYNGAGGRFVDKIGHGTAVAAVVGGEKYGVLKNCTLIDVRVNSKNSTLMVFLDSLMWTMKDIIETPSGKLTSVINLSYGYKKTGPLSYALNCLVEAAYALGISMVVSAGNDDLPTTWKDKIIVVGATNKNLRRAGFSNYGSAVSIFAPGVSVVRWSKRAPGNWILVSGTSYAAPQVAAVLAYLKVQNRISNATLAMELLYKTATPGLVEDAKGSQNRFLYNDSGR
ncbi:subtilisin-like protein [Myriangium duriaei CBS 260.36]|uniref:Subtilisin-like protein n=1 Tax=Myriangium duriaei CBS 260.36 TaxID=1168546 RepID=A0A9P4MBX9_9PEZI|nr:subtilisin-like protein [Myriangium duriaei CBS 260.36]